MTYDIATSFPCSAQSVRDARGWVRGQLSSHLAGVTDTAQVQRLGDTIDDIQLVVSELVTNSIRAGCHSVTVGVSIEAQCVRVGVSDNAPGTPTVQPPTTDEPRGRGLLIVAAVAADWGVRRVNGSKEVWATLSLT